MSPRRPAGPGDDRPLARPRPPGPCPAVFPGEPSTRCEGVEGHEGPHRARVSVEWETRDQSPGGFPLDAPPPRA
jgi:hypothetical protein